MVTRADDVRLHQHEVSKEYNKIFIVLFFVEFLRIIIIRKNKRSLYLQRCTYRDKLTCSLYKSAYDVGMQHRVVTNATTETL